MVSRTIFQGDCFKVTHTLEEDGPHLTRKEHYCVDYFTLTVLFHGRGNCFVERSSYSLAPGEAVVMRANELRHFRFEPGGLHERLSVYVMPSMVSPLWAPNLPLFGVFQDRPLGVGNKLSLEGGNGASVLSALEEIRAQMTAFTGPKSSVQEAELYLLILRLLVRLCAAEQPMREGESGRDDAVIRRVCQYVHENLPEKLTHRNIQESCRVSRYQLGEVFRRGTGMTLTEYIIQKRLIRVSELVLGGAKIENAAVKAGFQNYSHFYKMFYKYRGTSPKQYFSSMKPD